MSLKEKAIASVMVMVALYAAAVATWFLYSESAWKKASSRYEAACRKYRSEVETIRNKSRYEQDYESAKSFMPVFEESKATASTWRKKMREIAERNLVDVKTDSPLNEITRDDVHELPISVSWEASLEAIVKFMHELENTDEGMFAITDISMSRSNKNGYLRGNLTLNCAYMREE